MDKEIDYNEIRMMLYRAVGTTPPPKDTKNDKINLRHETLYEYKEYDVPVYEMSAANLEGDYSKAEGFFDSAKRPMVAYKKVQLEQKYRKNATPYKYHLRWCSFLREVIGEAEFKKNFIVTTDSSGYFDIVDAFSNKAKKKKLNVCKGCFDELKLAKKGYKLEDFDLNRFFREFIYAEKMKVAEEFKNGYSFLGNERNNYPSNWKKIADDVKKRKNYTCEECGARYAERDGNIQLHHIDNDRSNCTWNNLKVLCKSCHDKYHPTRPGAGK